MSVVLSQLSDTPEICFETTRRHPQRNLPIMTRGLLLLLRGLTPYPCEVANSVSSLEDCYGLLYREYFARGLCDERTDGLYFNSHSQLATATTFRMSTRCSTVGTISLFGDCARGLPLEDLYQREVAQIRSRGTRLAEVGMLSLSSEVFRRRKRSLCSIRKFHGMMSVFAGMFQYCKTQTDYSDLLITVHPRHGEIYEMLGFEQFAEVRSYDTVNGKPALPMRVSVKTLSETFSSLHLDRFMRSSLICDDWFSWSELDGAESVYSVI